MKRLLILLLCLSCCLQLLAQSNPDSTLIRGSGRPVIAQPDTSMMIIIISRRQGGWYKQGDKRLTTSDLTRVVKSNPKAYRLMVFSRACYWMMVPLVFGFGVAICALPFVLFNYGYPEGMVGIAAAIAIVSIPLAFVSIKLQDKAIHIYNGGLK